MASPHDPQPERCDGRGSSPRHPREITLPATAAGDSLEALAADRYVRTPVVYLLVLAVVVIGSAALPLIHVPVSVRATGMIRPSQEKHEIRAGITGVVADVRMIEGMDVAAGEPLLRVSTPAASAHGGYLLERRREVVSAIADLERLASAPGTSASSAWEPATAGFRAEVRSERSAEAERRGQIDRIRIELTRAELLLAQGLAAANEVERRRFELAQAEAAAERLEADTHARWVRELAEHRAKLRDLDREIAVTRADDRLTRVVAPLTGSLEAVVPIAPGGFVTAGERLATLSPRSALRVEAYLRPRDVVLVRRGDRARLRVDGFDPGDWGQLEGRVLRVADDHVIVGERPMFRIVIALDEEHLRGPQGRIGHLRRGMTVEVRIVVARPTVYSLLRHRMTNWIDPHVPDA